MKVIQFAVTAALLMPAARAAEAPATINLPEIRVPASTAYFEPDHNGARSSRTGISGWTNPDIQVLWFGNIRQTGSVDASIDLLVPAGTTSRLRLTLDKQSHEVSVRGQGTNVVSARFGSFPVAKPGYQKFVLESLNPKGASAGSIDALVLNGAALEEAHFNLKPRRNAASVHLVFPVGKGTNVAAFYSEATGIDEPLHTYYMACGWHRGYFGMQVNSPTERRIIFSVWDSGNEAVDRGKVADENRVKLVAKGEGVYSGDFGNEGTGGHSHLKYPWKTGEKQRFIVTAEPTTNGATIFSGFWFHPEKKEWMLISSWRAPKEGGYMRGLYSFSEDFIGNSGHVRRKALFGNQWIKSDTGVWTELTTATFSFDSTGKGDRLDRYMGVENGQFFLSHGGFIDGSTKFGEKFTRPATGEPPVIQLPPLTSQAGAVR